MKKNVLLILLAVAFTGLKSQSYYMCQGITTSTANTGTIFDSGGPNSNYSSYEGCYFLIKAGCAANNITLYFNSFSTESGYDYLTVYNGSTTASPVLASYSGTGNAPTLVATSGYMLLYFDSDGSYQMPGFSATWNMSSTGCAPVANYSMTVNECQGKVTFADASTQDPTSWLWNFGDSNGSTQQSPVHTYTAAGTYSVTMVCTNGAGSSTITKTVTVNPLTFKIGYLGAPIMHSAMSFTTDNVVNGQVYTWNFGDGGFGGTANCLHTYANAGTYTVELTLSSGNCVTTKGMQVVVDAGVGVEQENIPFYNAIVQPNPFVGNSTVNLQLAVNSTIRIELVNQLGQLMKVISDGSLTAGQYNFELKDIPAGVHYVKINDGNKQTTFKLISLN